MALTSMFFVRKKFPAVFKLGVATNLIIDWIVLPDITLLNLIYLTIPAKKYAFIIFL